MSTVALPAGHKVCHNHMSYTYTGKESTPQGLGYCAEAEEIGKVMTGRDKHMWTVGIKNAMKVWVRIPDQMVAKKEVAPMAKPVPAAPEAEAKEDEPIAEEPANEAVEEPLVRGRRLSDGCVSDEEDCDIVGPLIITPVKKAPAAKPKVPAAPKKAAKPKAAPAVADDTVSEASTTESKQPKRAPTAFNLFVKEKIAELRVSEPGLPQKDYMSKAAAAWNEYKAANGMPETKPKAPKAPKASAEAEAGEAPVKKTKKAAAKDDATSEKPKRAPTAYNIFIKEKMAELRAAEPGLQAKEYMSKAAAAYRESKAV